MNPLKEKKKKKKIHLEMSTQSEDIRFRMDQGRGKYANKTPFLFSMYAHGHQIRKSFGYRAIVVKCRILNLEQDWILLALNGGVLR